MTPTNHKTDYDPFSHQQKGRGMKAKKRKSLGQISYERGKVSGKAVWKTPWNQQMQCIKDAYEYSARIVAKEVRRRGRRQALEIED